jgi:hypothetical protein
MHYTKVCTSCQEELPATSEYFHNNINNKEYGLHTSCKKCRKKHDIKYRKQNKGKIKQLRHDNYLKHRDKQLKKYQAYYIKNKTKIQQYKLKNKNKTAKYRKHKYHSSIEFRLRIVLSSRVNRLIKGKRNKTLDLIGCDVKKLKQHLESKFLNGMNWENYGFYGWHIDHIIPCSSFDLTDPEQQKKCFHYTNLQPLWAEDNLRKSDKIL